MNNKMHNHEGKLNRRETYAMCVVPVCIVLLVPAATRALPYTVKEIGFYSFNCTNHGPKLIENRVNLPFFFLQRGSIKLHFCSAVNKHL